MKSKIRSFNENEMHIPHSKKNDKYFNNQGLILSVSSPSDYTCPCPCPTQKYSDIESGKDGNCVFHYFHLFMNFAFYLLIIPFRPVIHDGHYKLTRNKFQKPLCFLTWVLVGFRRLAYTRACWQSNYKHPILFYFYLAHANLHTLLATVFYWTFYTKLDNVEKMLEKINHCVLFSPSYKRTKVWFFVIFLHILFPTMGVISPLVGYDLIDSHSWTPSWLFRSYVADTRYAFFIDLNVTNSNIRPEWSEISTWDVTLSSLYILMSGCHELHVYFMSLLFGICIITLWTAAETFSEFIQCVKKDERENTSEIVLHLYYELKDFSNVMNDVWGLFCFWYIIDITPYLATDLDFGLRSHDWFAAIKMFRSVFFFGFNISLSGETFRKMQWFSTWLLERKNRDIFTGNISELELLLHELRSGPVGIGTPGFYQVNYSFGAQIGALIITFFIITLQFSSFKIG